MSFNYFRDMFAYRLHISSVSNSDPFNNKYPGKENKADQQLIK